ncbi:MAG: hypothetical protein A3C71_01040 [Candidatus Yanofskybacteria bacterium RIFCSPHIGHO2_02_FULL_43_15c]|uniref:Cell wall hydrolase SleB domain-containing protein n=1 Tax=Candidatus Yanofskybacteria bacterium RIFCSPHIGHO2_02_FULL_43_15c TaxID=1802679 RepID=A0A1F8FID5_9BACT|nr:MAG: hypothetical protein A3C71_01040 [Candidatus Yanofskybacteria bacterium RIFCSPHIGHO2_02_FULL_43_15c]
MDLVKKERIDQKIQKRFVYTFSVEQSGIYALLVSAKARSWFQNVQKFISFFSDDNLAVKINGVIFPKLSGKRGEFDGEASWNGNKLKGLRQVNFFIVYFDQGEQNLEFISKGSPFLESIEIYRVDKNQISVDPSEYNVEDGDKRPWFNVLTSKIGIISCFAKAIADSKTNEDDSNLQIRINGVRELNNTPKAHNYWFWCGRVLKGQPKTFERTLSLKPGFNYIEFWADRTPIFNELNLRVTKSERIPMVDDPIWTGDFYDDSEEMILARVIFGEARNQSEEAKIWVASSVPNRVEAKTWWGSTIHEVILQDQQYESFNQDNPNRFMVENPLYDPTQKQSWIDSYKVAKGILNGDTPVPSKATHFHDPRKSQEDFVKLIPDGQFLKRIDNLFFYWSPR